MTWNSRISKSVCRNHVKLRTIWNWSCTFILNHAHWSVVCQLLNRIVWHRFSREEGYSGVSIYIFCKTLGRNGSLNVTLVYILPTISIGVLQSAILSISLPNQSRMAGPKNVRTYTHRSLPKWLPWSPSPPFSTIPFSVPLAASLLDRLSRSRLCHRQFQPDPH
jgi:hypothetical protein